MIIPKIDKNKLQAPFPYFGGKSKIAFIVWEAFGDVKTYTEPFFGSGAVLLGRPNYNYTNQIEIICDSDGYICNVWRALQFAPDEVAKYCDWPVNHIDSTVRRNKLIEDEEYLLRNLLNDDEWYNSKLAGYWIWLASCWIGGGITSGNKIYKLGQIPNLIKLTGVHKLSIRFNAEEDSKQVTEPYNLNIYTWFRELSERLRYTQVVCGDWSRVCGGNWQDTRGIVGMFFDPPYSHSIGRDNNLYHHDNDVTKEVETWCLERGKKESYRIVLAGYEGEYEVLEKEGWLIKTWKSQGGYSNQNKTKNLNRYRERLWFSPHCLKIS